LKTRMIPAAFLLAVGLSAFQFSPCLAGWQKDMVCGGGSGGGCGGGGGGARRVAPQQSPADIAAEQARGFFHAGVDAYKSGDYTSALNYFQQAAATDPGEPLYRYNIAASRAAMVNEQGRTALRNGDYAAALNYFQQALTIRPDSEAYVANVAKARGLIATQQGTDAWKAGDVAGALSHFRQAFGYYPDPAWRNNIDLAQKELQRRAAGEAAATVRQRQARSENDAIAAAAAERKRAAAPEDSAGKATIAAVDPPAYGTRTGPFGTRISNPSDSDLGGSGTTTPVAVRNATDQLSSIAQSSAEAANLGVSDEAAKAKAGCGFDRAPCADYKSIDTSRVRTMGQSPGAAELFAQLPDAARNDKQIQQSMAYYQKLDMRKIDTLVKLDAVEQQIKGGHGDAKALGAQKATLSNDLKRYNADMTKTKAQIKKRLVAINVPWNEAPAPATADAAGQ
jgi:tetratricopeptide (TPR) repeat protein